MPVDGSAIVFEVVRDFDLDIVTPASLDPRAWIRTVKYFSLNILETVRGQCHVGDIKLILAKRAFRSNHLVVCIDIGFFSIRSSEPALSVLWRIAFFPTNFARVVALKVAFGIGGSEYRPRGQKNQLMAAEWMAVEVAAVVQGRRQTETV